MKKISREELNEMLVQHELWLKNEGGEQLNLEDVDLRDLNLRYANLRYANLRYANLRYVDLEYADLRYADLRHADLGNTDLRYADLRYADLRYADLGNTDLEYVETNYLTIGYRLACPEEGSFIGYKKANGCLVKLLILEDSKRSSATSMKCRCDKAKVLDIIDLMTNEKIDRTKSDYDNEFFYKVGEIVQVEDFDEDRWNECTTGIHFFINKENALKY